MKIVDRFGSRPGAELVRLPQGGERLLAVEHAAALLVNEQTAFRVVCTPDGSQNGLRSSSAHSPM